MNDGKRSRLPGPTPLKTKSCSGTNLQNTAVLAKRARITTSTSNLTKTRSIQDVADPTCIGRTSAASVMRKPLPNAMTTGRATTAVSGVRGVSQTRNAMRDRTNNSTLQTDTVKRAGLTSQKSTSTIGGGPKKRPAWDLKGRLEDMERKFASLESQNRELETNFHDKEDAVSKQGEQLCNYQSRVDDLQSENNSLRHERDNLNVAKIELERLYSAAQSEVSGLKDSVARLTASSVAFETERDLLRGKLSVTEVRIENLEHHVKSLEHQVRNLETQAAEDKATIEDMIAKEQKYETERRRLHNTIQELKGNIRVFCRIRPFLAGDLESESDKATSKYLVGSRRLSRSMTNLMAAAQSCDLNKDAPLSPKHIQVVDEKTIALVKPDDVESASSLALASSSGQRFEFEFDRIFDGCATQVDVFDELSQLVQSAIDGYHVCVFAYGQTGSGKTFTMEGGSLNQVRNPSESLDQDADDGENDGAGMIPRTLRLIFEQAKRLEKRGWNFDLEASFIEIYNEELRDLLATEKGLKYEIKMTKDTERDGCVTVSNLKTENVTSEAQIETLIRRARRARTVAATNCNERSSRSHSVFRLQIVGKNVTTSEHTVGVLNLIDLAGSERLKASLSEGVRLTETKSINKSLANLGNVIMALAQKDSHVPYRNSKLTHLLQGSLGGNSKTLMFVNISPVASCFNETLNSLRFATKVNQCQIGTARKRVK